MSCQIAPFVVTLNDLESDSRIASLSYMISVTVMQQLIRV